MPQKFGHLHLTHTLSLHKYILNLNAVRHHTRFIQRTLGVSDYALAIQLTGKVLSRRLNAHYRGKDKPTDVLAFPFRQLNYREPIQPSPEGIKLLGKLVISVRLLLHTHSRGQTRTPPSCCLAHFCD